MVILKIRIETIKNTSYRRIGEQVCDKATISQC